MRDWRAQRWVETLTAAGRAALEGGSFLLAVSAWLRLIAHDSSLDGAASSDTDPAHWAGVRLLRSVAARLDELSHLSASIDGVLGCCMCDENARKVEHPVLIAMFDKYRAQVIARSRRDPAEIPTRSRRDPDEILMRS